ncbi:MAG: CREA protein, partial [Mesorhizobium sp.]
AIKDPKVEGVTCHVSYFDRGVIDRLQKGNWFEDPSDSSIACRQTGPITIGDIDMSEAGEEVFKQGISLIWKKQVVNRIYDKANETLIYLSHSRQVQDGSAKMSVTTVPLYGQNVVWTNGKPK